MNSTLILEKSTTIRTIEPMREQILAAFAEHSAIEIDASAIAEVDLSLIQLIEAARAHGAREGKTLRLTQPANATLAALLQRAGFLTESTAEVLDFWCHGDQPQ